MVFTSYNPKKNKSLFISPIFCLITLIIIITEVNCSSLNTSEIDNYNNTMNRYQQVLIQYKGFSKQMEKITLNVFLRVRFKGLQRDFEDLRKEISELKASHEKKNITVSKNLEETNKLLTNFEKSLINIIKAYKRFDQTKKIILHMIKVFIIILSVIIFIALTLIGIGSYFVIKHQKKYAKLHEEVSIRIGETETDSEKNTHVEEEKKEKMDYIVKSTQEDIRSTKSSDKNQVIIEPNNPPSKDYLNGKNKK